jgi:hypothetical protein
MEDVSTASLGKEAIVTSDRPGYVRTQNVVRKQKEAPP